jgi:hypothetical protein
MGRPSYSPDLALPHFQLFRPLKRHLAGKRFATDADAGQPIAFRQVIHDTDIFIYMGDESLVARVGKFVRIGGDYVESGVLHLLPIYRVQIEVRFK